MSGQSWLLLLLAGVAVCMDFLMEKVVNSFILLGLAVGMFFCMKQMGLWGLVFYGTGVFVPLCLLLPLFYFRMLGAGDIKIFAVLGGLLGYADILKVLFASFVLGGVLSLAFLISCGNFKERISYFFNFFKQYYETGKPGVYIQKGKSAENFHFTVPILLSVMLYAGGFY